MDWEGDSERTSKGKQGLGRGTSSWGFCHSCHYLLRKSSYFQISEWFDAGSQCWSMWVYLEAAMQVGVCANNVTMLPNVRWSRKPSAAWWILIPRLQVQNNIVEINCRSNCLRKIKQLAESTGMKPSRGVWQECNMASHSRTIFAQYSDTIVEHVCRQIKFQASRNSQKSKFIPKFLLLKAVFKSIYNTSCAPRALPDCARLSSEPCKLVQEREHWEVYAIDFHFWRFEIN